MEYATAAIKRFHGHLAVAGDADGGPHPVLQGFARHLHEHLLIPSGRGGGRAGAWVASVPAGCFTYEAPRGIQWKCGVRSAECGVQSQGPKSKV